MHPLVYSTVKYPGHHRLSQQPSGSWNPANPNNNPAGVRSHDTGTAAWLWMCSKDIFACSAHWSFTKMLICNLRSFAMHLTNAIKNHVLCTTSEFQFHCKRTLHQMWSWASTNSTWLSWASFELLDLGAVEVFCPRMYTLSTDWRGIVRLHRTTNFTSYNQSMRCSYLLVCMGSIL